MKSNAQIRYELDVAKRPTYHDGTPRKPWHDLESIAQWSWARPQYGIEYPDASGCYVDCGEGPWDTMVEARRYLNAEVGAKGARVYLIP